MRGWDLWGTPQGYLGLLTCSNRSLGWSVEGPSPQERSSSCGWAWSPPTPRPILLSRKQIIHTPLNTQKLTIYINYSVLRGHCVPSTFLHSVIYYQRTP